MHDQQSTPQESSRATKLLRAAAFAATLVPLGTITAQATTLIPGDIECVSQDTTGICTGIYGSGGASHRWLFYETKDEDTQTFNNLLYTFTLSGTITGGATFSLLVTDSYLPGGTPLTSTANSFPVANCIPTRDAARCGVFDVSLTSFDPVYFDGDTFDLAIAWYSNGNPLSDAPFLATGNTTILRSSDTSPPFTYTDALSTTFTTGPIDPALSASVTPASLAVGRFAAATSVTPVPEPSTLLLVATGLIFLGVAARSML